MGLSWLPPLCPFNDPLISDLMDDVAWVMKQMVKSAGGDDSSIFMRAASLRAIASARLNKPGPSTKTIGNGVVDVDDDPKLPIRRQPKPRASTQNVTVDIVASAPTKRKAKDNIAPPAKKAKRSGLKV